MLVPMVGRGWSERRGLVCMSSSSSPPSLMSKSGSTTVAAGGGGGGLAEDTNGPPVSNVHTVFPVSSSRATSRPSAKATRSWSGRLAVEVVSWPVVVVGAVGALHNVEEVHRRRRKIVEINRRMCLDSLMVDDALGMER